ncbi:MAG: HAMP domain-containing sensor histidine kinase, partial [Lentisphaeria bacterium]|nr:HAMP domain-containing sensor histidine kinase [Lentisphaeria bacterium]
AVNQRFTEDAARNAARLVDALRLPRSPRLADELAGIFGGEVAFVDQDGKLAATSLAVDRAAAFADFHAAAKRPALIRLDGLAFRPAVADLSTGELWLLAPEARLRQARWRAVWPILLIVLPATLLAALLGGWVTRAALRPLARLGDEFDTLSARLNESEDWSIEPKTDSRRPEPAELARLANAFHRLVEDLRAARLRLAESSRLAAVGRLSASVAHELRNPLAGIRMNAQALAQSLAREGREDPGLTLIIKETDRLAVRLEELLGLAAGSRPPRSPERPPARTSLANARDTLLSLLNSQFAQAGVELAAVGDYDHDLPIPGDDLRRILLNLLLNALEVSAPGQRVELHAETAGENLLLTVADRGGGIDPAIGDIFAPFVTGKPHGVGLGLAISRELAERNGASLAACNRDGGAHFVLAVPLAPEPGTAP